MTICYGIQAHIQYISKSSLYSNKMWFVAKNNSVGFPELNI